MIKKMTCILLTIPIQLSLLACNWSNKKSDDEPIATISLNKNKSVLLIGTSEILEATISPQQKLIWSTSDKNIVTVEMGMITGIKPGTAVITVSNTDETVKTQCSITVCTEIIPVSGISLNLKDIIMRPGSKKQLVAVTKPSNASNQYLTWESENNTIAIVSPEGEITAKNNGTTAIKVCTDAGQYTEICNVTVSNDLETTKVWNKTDLYTGNNQAISTLQMHNDSNGNIIAMWRQWDSSRHKLWAMKYNALDKKWGSPERINTASQSVKHVQLAVDRSGKAVAVWIDTQIPNNIRANTYSLEAGWSQSQCIVDSAFSEINPEDIDIKFNQAGTAYLVYTHIISGTEKNTYITNCNNENQWGEPLLLSNSNHSSGTPFLAFNSNNNALCVWKEYTYVCSKFSTNPDLSWWNYLYVQNKEGISLVEKVSFDSTGNAIAIWKQFNENHHLKANYFIPGDEAGERWQSVFEIEDKTEDVNYADLAVSASGKTMLAWSQGNIIYARCFSADRGWPSGWDNTITIDTSDYPVKTVHIIFNDTHTATAVWAKAIDSINDYYLYSSQFTDGSGWSPPLLIGKTSLENFQLITDTTERPLLIWTGNNTIYYSRLE